MVLGFKLFCLRPDWALGRKGRSKDDRPPIIVTDAAQHDDGQLLGLLNLDAKAVDVCGQSRCFNQALPEYALKSKKIFLLRDAPSRQS
ncbi:hypothetical protein D3877_13595 [Azospirillum cavernae]|uniref:Uncharacterized protein n=1 Tax=Azospirillum cavernae TaxID=2320860 RepID=A0A418VVN8_9PROT|nr:hypothetical protein [Azospirillum cavernae]RJF81226.1 hypothetical protein D3877_13595 [Azospirillum cavernae]